MEFLALWEKLTGQSEGQAKAVESALLRLYSEPSRKYHNLKHIRACLDELKELKVHDNSLADSDAEEITIAIWFHDAIYDSKSKTNEDDSVRLLEQFSEGMDPGERQRIRGMILATKDHLSCNSMEEQVMLDLDLSILGKSESEFDAYDRAIRIEYQWVPKDVYREKRAEVLAAFLKRDRIYKTDYFYNKYERSARLNLERAVVRLSAPAYQNL